MSLQLILGNSGSGKSEFIYRHVIKASLADPQGSFLVIVPEQFTMQTQRELVRLHPDGGIMNIDILSFPRLAHRVFEETGMDRRSILTETGKSLMIRSIAMRMREELPVLGSRLNMPGYIAQAKSVLSELMQYDVSEQELARLAQAVPEDRLLQAKLEDIRKLYHAFLEEQRDTFFKPEELLHQLCQVAPDSALLKRSTLVFDCFTGFTPSQMEVMRQLLILSPQIYVTVTIDGKESFTGPFQEHELFALSKRTIRSLLDLAGSVASRALHPFEIQDPVILSEPVRFRKGGELEALEQNLFRRKKRTAPALKGEISLHEAPSPSSEALFAAGTISRMLKEGTCRCRDIAVITGDLSAYETHLLRAFRLYDIPVFVDRTSRILLNPCLEFVRTAFEAALSGFDADPLIRLLRTGMCGFTMEETDILETFLLSSGIRGRAAWEKPFTFRKKHPSDEEKALAAASEPLRERLMQWFGPFSEQFGQKEADAAAYARCLHQLLLDLQIQQQLRDQELLFSSRGEEARAREYSQIYGILIRLLEETVNLLGSEKLSGREFAKLLDAGFEEAKVGIIPPTIDQVQLGDMERTRLSHVKYLFFLGVNDGWVPALKPSGGLLSDLERELLKERGAMLAPAGREENYIQRFYLYHNLTQPSVHLFLSWCRSGNDGKTMRPSFVVNVLRDLFPYLEIRDEELVQQTVLPVTLERAAMDYIARGLGDETRQDAAWRTVLGLVQKDPQLREPLRKLEAAVKGPEKSRLPAETARRLYGEQLEGSITRLEQFAGCAFAHFASYGLRLSPRQIFEVTGADIGTIFHGTMEQILRECRKESFYSWEELAAGKGADFADRSVDEWINRYGQEALFGDARTRYQITRMKRIIRRSVQTVSAQIQAGSFTPKAFEISFGMLREVLRADALTYPLTGGTMRLQGRIDRIDTCETDRELLVRVIDYKSGSTAFDPSALYYGLQLQLMVYLQAACDMQSRFAGGRETVPAGIFYYHMLDPLLEREAAATPELARAEMMKKLKLDGVVNDRQDILRAMDAEIGGSSLIIPAGMKNNGELRKEASAIPTGAFDSAGRFVRRKLTEEGNRILAGEIAASPYRLGDRCACDYCDYRDVCGFDRKLPGMRERELARMKKEEAWDKIVKEGGDSDGSALDR